MSLPYKRACTLTVKDAVLAKLGASVSFGSGNNLLVFPAAKQKQATENNFPKSGNMHEIQWDTFLYNPITRKLLNECHSIFISLQKALQDVQDDNKKQRETISSTSKKYRSIVSVCHFNLQKSVESSENEEQKVVYSAQSELFYTIEVIWNLCEILFIDSTPGDLVLSQLLEWVCWHSDEGHKRVAEVMSFETVSSQPVYWEAIYVFVLLGNLDKARKLLKRNQDANRDDFLSMDELLRKMPVYQSGKSVPEFSLNWKRWQEECNNRLESGEFSSLSYLETLAKILSGDRNTIHSLSELCGTWYHCMVSWLLYSNPCVKGKDLASIARDCWVTFQGSETPSVFDQILMNILSYDFSEVLIQICYFPDSWWFVAHLCDLLFHNKQLKLESGSASENPASLREFLIINFSSCLMTHASLWEIGVDYLDTCPERGRNVLECYLEKIPLQSHTKALKVLRCTEVREMKALARSICMVMAKQASACNQVGTALTWAIRAEDSKYVSYLADRFLQGYCESGKFSSLDLLDSLGSSMLVSERLTFLGKYREFHRFYEDKQFKLAADLLISLLASNLAPKYFWMTLLLDSIPLLEAEDLVFSSQQTHTLLYSLQELNPSSSEKIQMLRLSLARNLSRSFIEESTAA